MKKQLLFKFLQFLFRKLPFRITALTVFTLLTVQTSFAQKWNVIGDETNISSTASYFTSITVVGDVPYVVYTDGSASGGISRVKKRNSDGTWTSVGTNSPFASTQVTYTRIFNDNTGKLYIAAVDKTGGLLSVATLDTNDTWVRTNISTNSVAYTGPSDTRFDMAFDSNNVPYIAYSERISTTSGYPWVKRLVNGVWETVGSGAVQTTDTYAAAVDIALDTNNVPYLVYINQVYNATTPSPIKAYRYSSNNWESISPPSPVVSTSTLSARYSSITMDSDNNPVVCYFNSLNSSKSTIIRYNKTTSAWDSPQAVSTRDANNLYLITDTAGNLYNIFSDALIGSGLSNTVRVFKKESGTSTFAELQNLPITSPSGVGIDATGDNSTVARTPKIATLSIAVGSDTSKPYIIYTKTNSSGVVTPIVRLFTPLIYTKPITNITSNTATTGGEIGSDGGSPITERGIVYGTNANPTVADTKIIDTSGSGIGSFATTITGLSAAVDYHVRAYAINGTQTMYGNDVKFSITPSDPTNVKIADNGSTVVMDNGIVKATISKTSGMVTSLIYNGLEMVQGGYGGGSIYWSWNMPNYQNPSGCTYSLITNPSTNNFNSAEIKMHMTWDGTATTAAMDVDIYYSLQRNVSGLYASATLSHPASYPALPGGEWRMASYPNPRLDWLSVDALRNRLMPSSSDLVNAAAVTGAPPEITRLTTGIYKDKYECKYDYSADFGDIDTWGWSSTADNVGLWITAPSKEYYPGGPMKRELTGHANPVLLNMLGGTHYEQGSETSVAAGEEWQKNYGPFLIYCNKVAAGTANAPIALWENAKTQAKTEQAAWPYSWHNNSTYVKESGRGTVTGKLVINDSGNPSASAANTWVGLAIPPTGSSSSIDFEDWSKNYQFWVKTDGNGNFSIPDVLPGTYSLFAFGPGTNGQLSLSNYATVTAATTTALGNVNWTPTRIASTIWEIGKPDRNAMEFKHGNDWWTSNTYPDARYGIFMNYPDEFPNDVNFTIGQSNIATDWNFVHPYNKSIQSTSPKWNVNFNLSSAPVSGSNASVYVALAANFSAALILSVNGTNVTVPATGFAPGNNSNAMIRKGIHGAFTDTRFTFPASYLKAGANQITFTLRVTGSATSGEVMYDYVRLEADLSVCLKSTFTSAPTNTNTVTAVNSCDAVVNYTAVASENPTYSYVFTGATTGSGIGTGSGSKFNKGTTHVAITATNSCGNVTHSFDIIVSDSTKPTIIAPQNIQISTTNNNPVTGVQLGTPTVTDNCSTANNLTVSNDAPASFPQGTTTVIWTATDESGNSQTSTQQVIVTTNTAPTAVSDQISLSEGATSSTLVGGATSVLTNDTDAENNVLTATLVSNVTNGTLTFNGNGTFSYVHNGSETTTDSFSYKVNDGTSDSNIVTVSIAIAPVNDAPIAMTDAITVAEGGTANGTTVFANDTDAENNSLSATLVSNVTNGTLTLNSNGTFSYIHNGSETTTDSFSYKANDGTSDSNIVIVSITVIPVNDAPIAMTDAISVANAGTTAALVGNGTSVLANDTDIEDNTLTAVLVSNATNGSLTLNSNGTFSYVHNGSNTTSDSFTYKAYDGTSNSNVVTVSITVTPVNHSPIASADVITVAEGGTANGSTVLANDTDADNNTLTAVLVSNVTKGTLTLNSNGTFSYVHNGSESTSDSFSYKAYDGVLYSNVVTVGITVTPVNDAPVAVADAITVTEGGTVNGTTVLINDTDVENNPLTATLVSNVSNGTLTLNSNGTYNYVHNGSETTTDSFTYKANDGTSNSNVVTVNITVTPVNDAPIALADAISVANGGTAAALVVNGTSVLANDTDAENNALTAILVSNVTNGSLTLNSNGTFSYVHNGSNTTSDSFSYKANDGTSNSNVVTVNIAIAQFTLANNNFTIESKSETCANKNNGQIIINALNSYNYVAKINGTNYPFVNNSLTVSNLSPGTYSVCITITGKSFEQCFSITIGKGGTIAGKSTISYEKVAVEITEGTAPFEVLVNGVSQFETAASSFTVDVKQGDLLQVKTAKACEGIYAKNIVGMSGNVAAYPNPTHGWVEITVPTTKKEAIIELYTVAGQLISSGNFTIVNQKAQLNLDKVATGAYFAKVYLETPVSVKIIKY